MTNVLITRSYKNSFELNKTLSADGFKIFCEPLFKVKKLGDVKFNNNFSAVIISSSNACDAVINSGFSKDIKIFSVGKKTAQNLSLAGFYNISIAPNNSAESLKNMIIKEGNRDAKILYLHGSIVTLDFAEELAKNDFKVEKILVYETQENSCFSWELLEKTKSDKFDQILIFSKNSARIFFKLATKHNLLEYFLESQILCFSKEILDEAKNLGFKKCKTFSDLPILANFYD